MTITGARTCGTCTMCCKVYRVPELAKREGQWCRHCDVGAGCRIYGARPDQCRDFVCLWLQDPTLGAEWKPNISKLVLSIFPSNGFLYVQVDPGNPFAWQREPYFSRLKAMAERLLTQRRHILAFVNREATLVMPTGAVPIGPMSAEDGFTVRQTFTAAGIGYVVERAPRLSQL